MSMAAELEPPVAKSPIGGLGVAAIDKEEQDDWQRYRMSCDFGYQTLFLVFLQQNFCQLIVQLFYTLWEMKR